MKHRLILFLIMLLLPAASVCGSDKDYKSTLQYITKGKAAIGQHNYVEAFSLLIKGKKNADRGAWPDLMFEANCDLGICYTQISENGKAMDYFYQAYKICKEANLGWKNRLLVTNGIASIYFDDKNYAKAEEMMKECYRGAKEEHDSTALVSYAINLAQICNKTGKYKMSASYIADARRYLPGCKDKREDYIDVTELEMLYNQKQYNKVKDKAYQMLANRNLGINTRNTILMQLMRIARHEKDTEKAFLYAMEVRQTTELSQKPELYDFISTLYSQSGNYPMALLYKDSMVIYKDSLIMKQNRQLVETNRIKLEIFNIQSKMDSELAKSNSRKQIYLLLLVVTLLILAMTIIIIRNMRIRNSQAKRLMKLKLEKQENERLLAETKMKETEMAARYQQEIMRQKLEQKNKELAATSMFISSRNLLIEEVLQKVQEIRQSENSLALNELSNHLKQLMKTTNEHDTFLINFQSANPGLLDKIRAKHPNLSDSDLQFIAYIYMNIPTRDIASLLNITPESCKRRKIRLSKKLGLKSSVDIYPYISKI